MFFVVFCTVCVSLGETFDWGNWQQWIPAFVQPKPATTLIKLAILHRHGDRVAEKTFKTDPFPCNDLNIWPDGTGQLTIKGKKRMLDVGKFIRKRYSDFLDKDPLQVYSRSSPVNRCLNSAQLVLAGAYPPFGRLVFDQSIAWQPIPVHTESYATEQMLITPSKMNCAASKVAKQLQKDTDEVKSYDQENWEFLQFVSKQSGNNVSSITKIHPVFDSLNIAQQNGKKWPDWVTEEVFAKVKLMDNKVDCINSGTPLILRLDTGVFLHDVKHNFGTKIVKDNGEKKVFFYSAHDSKLTPVLKALAIFDGKNPDYGSSLFFELHQLPDGKQVVRLYYVSDTESGEVHLMRTRGCPSSADCDVRTFFQGLADFVTDEETHADECKAVPTLAAPKTDCFPEIN